MSDWVKENITLGAVLKVIGFIVTMAVTVAVLKADVGTIKETQQKHIQEYKEYRQSTVPNTYMRKDVAEQVIIRLERIERKIDNMSE